MDYIRRVAVRAVEENGYSPELVIAVLELSRSCMYNWLKRYREQGLRGLEQVALGAAAQVTAEMEKWLVETVKIRSWSRMAMTCCCETVS